MKLNFVKNVKNQHYLPSKNKYFENSLKPFWVQIGSKFVSLPHMNIVWEFSSNAIVIYLVILWQKCLKSRRNTAQLWVHIRQKRWKSKNRVTSSNPRVTSSNPRVTSSNPRVTSSNLRVTSLNLEVTSSNLLVTSSNPQVRRLKARDARLKTRVRRLNTRVVKLKAQIRRLTAQVQAIKRRVRL